MFQAYGEGYGIMLSLTLYGPFSMKMDEMNEHPGPPSNHTTSGAWTEPFWLVKSQ